MASKDGRIDARDWSLLAVLSVLWGGSFFFNGVALKELPPLTLVFLRVFLAALILLPLVRAYRIDLPRAPAGWKGDQAREAQVLNALFPLLNRDREVTLALFELVKNQPGY